MMGPPPSSLLPPPPALDARQDDMEWHLTIATVDGGYNGGTTFVHRVPQEQGRAWKQRLDQAVVQAREEEKERLLWLEHGHSVLSVLRIKTAILYESTVLLSPYQEHLLPCRRAPAHLRAGLLMCAPTCGLARALACLGATRRPAMTWLVRHERRMSHAAAAASAVVEVRARGERGWRRR